MKIEIIYTDKIKDFKRSMFNKEDCFINKSEKIELENESLDSCKKEITKWIDQRFIDHRTKNKYQYIPIQNVLKINILTEE